MTDYIKEFHLDYEPNSINGKKSVTQVTQVTVIEPDKETLGQQKWWADRRRGVK
jgi:hypothetical protein